MKRTTEQQVLSGLRLAALLVLTILTAGLLLWGTLVVTSKIAKPAVFGWVALVVGFLIMLVNLRGWARMLPGLLALAALNAFVMAASGHLLNDPSIPVSRGMALGAGVSLVIGSLLSSRFGRRLSVLDRVVLVAYVSLFLWGVVTQLFFVSFSLGTLVLAVPWIYRRVQSRRSTR